ncbi:ATP-binding protein [Nonomuraea soli]|uniref:DNA-binding CsgD family transcriptional regulator n=1 Tax=Nonomuraea soli TaxID=1032476 RepID=A0A7W0HQE8_9ACTN|nr:LuxR family transcriptional regulator [Nonomuraea soli]MBA2891727.1 DNA-binding CsgD family transcriptional regulator [Nonomuraea soli]
MDAKWPFVGREDELRAVRLGLRSGAGVMIAGAPGVGKSRLAAQVGSTAAVRAIATETTSIIPFGAFAHVLAGSVPSGENLLHWAERRLLVHGADPLISVDDAQWLDPASAGLLHHLAVQRSARLLVTVRDDEPLPGPIAALWKDELLVRVELDTLGGAEVRRVLESVLGGEVDVETAGELALVSGGNLLYLRELVQAGRAQGRLTDGSGTWCWRGELSVTTRLRELVSERIGHLEPVEREALELVAFGEPLGTELLSTLTCAEAVERLEDRGLVTELADGRRLLLRMGHPLYGEIVRSGCGALRTRRLRRLLAECTEAAGLRRREDLLRAAVWRLDSGSASDPRMLLDAAQLAWGAQDIRLAARLARAAVEAGAGGDAVAMLGHALAVLGDAGEAKALLRLRVGSAVTEAERAQQALALGLALSRSGEVEEAHRVLDAAQRSLTETEWRQEVLIYRGAMEFFLGRLTQARRTVAELKALGPLTERGRAHATALESWLAAHGGRHHQAAATVEQLLATADRWRDLAYHGLPTALDARCAAYLFAGDLPAAARAADSVTTLVGTQEVWDMSVAGFGAHRAAVSRLSGDAHEAMRRCRQDVEHVHRLSPYLARCLGELAQAAALAGDLTTARRALERAEAIPTRWALTDQPVMLARAWVAAANGDLDCAVRDALAAADLAAKRELAGFQLLALYDVTRFGGAHLVAARLAELARRMDGPFARLCAQHAAAVAGRDTAALRAVASAFEQLGMLLFAAEATAHEASLLRKLGYGAAARGARTRAWALAHRCPGARTPALVDLAAPDLTPRQREIVQLAARGLTNRQIADRLTLSMRTVANHLQAVYDKLGVNDRAEVGRLLSALAA